MSVAYAGLLFGLSLGASLVGGLLGMAGGVLIVPALTMLGIDIRTAVAASIVSVIASSCASAAPLLRTQLTNVRLALVLELATTLGAVSGVFLTGLLPTSLLFFVFAAILVVSAKQMLARRLDAASQEEPVPGEWGTVLRLHGRYVDPSTGVDVGYVVRRLPTAMALMYAAGIVSALLGIGSGVLKIPAMDTALRLPLKVSSATSNFMIGVTAAASAGAYFMRGDIHPEIAAPVALGSVAGALLGARLFIAVSNERLRLLFVAILGLLAVQMTLQGLGIHLLGAMH
ncbi:sulfite exporter TauE/SafE family protein [Labilithrix luteola]|uniref:sulfite exporter TauE/SafE family protein n=1 Tax=Labilithrix luteola TaxID=1391654 RepID=UPI000A8D1E4E|nr:sulfite exporter TauE/SafE family protein [Labilithrix luteola]